MRVSEAGVFELSIHILDLFYYAQHGTMLMQKIFDKNTLTRQYKDTFTLEELKSSPCLTLTLTISPMGEVCKNLPNSISQVLLKVASGRS